jgi:aspartyl/asparaginyl beta-hydroxylase (cupin superfamily)/Flp pilus assembly protein TadD
LSTVNPAPLDEASVIRGIQASKAEAAAGRVLESDQILARVAQAAPNHPAVLNELGVRMLGRGAAEQARQLFTRATSLDAKHPALWANLASSLRQLGRRNEEREAIEKALLLEPRHLSALLQKAAYHEEMGERRQAARTYQHALETIPPGATTPPNVREALEHAKAVVAADRTELIAAFEQPLAEIRARHGGKAQRRVDQCLAMIMGQRRAFHSQPTFMYFPELPAIEFFDRADFPWLDAVEAATAEIRAELLRVMVSDREGLQPYVDFPPSLPLDQWQELNRSRRWSAYFLWNKSEAFPGHIARCPTTARILESAPRCRVERRAPTAFFSILDPGTRIPAHTGVTNTRLTVHLPLIIPPNCGFRVGNTTREWVPGQAWVFDDTIEHEAWNLSDTPRAILIFDIWNPLLSEAERDMIRTATEIYANHYGLPADPQ